MDPAAGAPGSAATASGTTTASRRYYLGCRKASCCACETCRASIDATRDLVRTPDAASARRFSAASAAKNRRPAGAESDSIEPPWTPPMRYEVKSRRAPGREPASARRFTAAAASDSTKPPMRSTARSRRAPGREPAPARARAGKGGCWSRNWPLYAATVLGFLLLVWVDTPEAAAGGSGPSCRRKPWRTSAPMRAWRLAAWSGSPIAVRTTVSKSVARVSVWGSPLRTSGLLPRALSARQFTILSGEITEWSDWRVWPTVRASNGSSWVHRRQSAAVRLEPVD